MMEKDAKKRRALEANLRLVQDMLEVIENSIQTNTRAETAKLLVQLSIEIAVRLSRYCQPEEIADLYSALSEAVETEAFENGEDPYTTTIAFWQRRQIQRISPTVNRLNNS